MTSFDKREDFIGRWKRRDGSITNIYSDVTHIQPTGEEYLHIEYALKIYDANGNCPFNSNADLMERDHGATRKF